MQLAHQVAGRFPDGQLYVNLRGYDPDQPLAAGYALAGFLRSLGMPGQDIPAREAERAARYRTMLAGRRMLVLLDNAGSVEQVRPLLPGTPTCATLVTSRDSLAGLVARDGAVRLDLDLLPLADAVTLIRALIGERAGEDPRSAAVLAVQCCRLPLALRITAELAATRPAAPLADLTAELHDQHSRLDLLDAGGDPGTAVRAVFSWSCRHLETSAARAFRLLGLHPHADFDAYAAAALTGTGLEQAQHLLGRLSRAHLIQPARPGRYGMHDLLRAYAQELAAKQDTAQERRTALTRLLDHYLYTASAAMNALFPAERHRRPAVRALDTPVPSVASPATAQGWLDAERANLTAIAVYAAAHGWPAHAISLAKTLFRYLESAGHYTEITTITTQARQAARDTGDRSAEAEALNSMTLVDLQQGRYEQASDQLIQALTLYQQADDQAGEGRALGNLGLICYQQGRYQQAADYQRQSLKSRRDTHDPAGEANTLNNLALIEIRQGQHARAAAHLRQSLVLYQQTGDLNGEAYALSNLGHVNTLQASYQQAAGQLGQALSLFRQIRDPVGEGNALTHLGELDLLRGRNQQAGTHLRRAITISREIGDPSSEAEALNGLGEVLLAVGQPGDAHGHHASALTLTAQIGDKYQQARAHNGLGHAYHAIGDPGKAREHWHEAIALYEHLGLPEADQVRAQLTATAGEFAPGP